MVAWPPWTRAPEPSRGRPARGRSSSRGSSGWSSSGPRSRGTGPGSARSCRSGAPRSSSCSARSSRWRSVVSRRRGWGARGLCSSSQRSRSSPGPARRSRGRSSPTGAGTCSTRGSRTPPSWGSGSCSPGSPDARRRARRVAARARHGGRARVGAPGQGRALARSGGRPGRAAAGAGRVLERARAPCGRRDRARALARHRRGRRAPVRVAGTLLAYAATLALLLTLSRAGAIAGAAVVALWLALSRERLEGGLLLAASAGPAVLVGAWAFTRPALVEDVALRSDREADGAVFGVLALVGAAPRRLLVATLVPAARSVGPPEASGRVLVGRRPRASSGGGRSGRRGRGRGLLRPLVRRGRERPGPARLARSEQPLVLVERGVGRVRGPRAGGAGAGSFEVARKRYRVDARNVRPAAQRAAAATRGRRPRRARPLRRLVRPAAWVCACAVRRLGATSARRRSRSSPRRPRTLLHALVDYSWDFLAVTAPTLLALGVLAGAGVRRGRSRGGRGSPSAPRSWRSSCSCPSRCRGSPTGPCARRRVRSTTATSTARGTGRTGRGSSTRSPSSRSRRSRGSRSGAASSGPPRRRYVQAVGAPA